MREDRDRWNTRYDSASDDVQPRGEPELVALDTHLVSSGLAIEVACGKGANALYLATRGYRVVAADVSSSGLRACRRTAARMQLQVYPVVIDFDRSGLPDATFSLVSVVRYLNRNLYPAIIDALCPGGLVFYKTFNRRHLQAHPGFNRSYLLEDGELQRVFAELTIIDADESGAASWILARR